MGVIGYWGYLMFEVNSDWWQYPSNIKRTAQGRWYTSYPANSHDRPRRQFLGPDVGEITFQMHFDQRFNNDIRVTLDLLTKCVNEGVAGAFVIGTKVMGHNLWVAEKMEIDYTEVLAHGVISQADVTVTLKEY